MQADKIRREAINSWPTRFESKGFFGEMGED